MAVWCTVSRRFCRVGPVSTIIALPTSCLQRRLTTASAWTTSSLTAKLWQSTVARPPTAPRTFPSEGFEIIDQDQAIEEEGIPQYKAEHFYPVRLGEVFNDRFQTVAKLGYGSSSTIWLAHDLWEHHYVALKVYIHNSLQHRELPFYEHLKKSQSSKHLGASNIRQLLDSFEIIGPHGKHIVLCLQASQMSIHDMDMVFMEGRGFDEAFVKSVIQELLEAVDFLHTEVHAVHTGNLLLGSKDNSQFQVVEKAEFSSPVPRKELSDRTIYLSRLMKPKDGPLLLADFGEVRLGPGPHAGDIMPVVYRAPETLLRIQWSYAVDIWSVGLTAWDLLEAKNLFRARNAAGGFSDGVHLSELIAALGPPPVELLNRNRERAQEYWDEHGKWTDFVPIPTEKSLDASETKLEDKAQFLCFIRRALTWDPRERPTARELLQDPWLGGQA